MKLSLAVVAVLVPASAAFAQPFGPALSEFRVNTYTTSYQTFPAVANDNGASFLVVWAGYGAGAAPTFAIWAQRYAPGPVGAPFRVNTYATGVHNYPRVAGRPGASGPDFVVVWQSNLQDGNMAGVFARRVNESGPVGSEFQVNTHTTGLEGYPDVSMDGGGHFVVTWTQPDADTYGVFARLYASTGAALTAPFRVNTYTTNRQFVSSVAANYDGSFVVVWASEKQFGAYFDIVGQRLSSTGTPLGGEFLIESTTTQPHRNPAVAAVGTNAGFVVTWPSKPGTTFDLYARRYDSTGAPLTGTFRVNTTTTYDDGYPVVASDAVGDFTIVWTSAGGEGSLTGAFGQRYGTGGEPLGGELRVNTYTTGYQYSPRVSEYGAGSFLVVWTSAGQDGSDSGVFGRDYCRLAGDVDGNFVIDVADVFSLINHLFAGGPAPVFPSDANGDGVVDVGDVFYLINYLFAAGPAPVCA